MILANVAIVALLAVAFHAVLRRCSPIGVVPSFVAVAAVGGLCLSLWLHGELKMFAEVTSALLVYALLCELYLFFVTLSLTSISANILAALHDSPMSSADLSIKYQSREMVVARLDRMIKAKLATLDSANHFVVTPRGVKLMIRLDQARRFFHSGAG
jgi:uncharacterized membrane protein YcgQ (UPF0703/DUF1980 family)